MARAKDRRPSAGRPLRRASWTRRLTALATGAVAGLVLGALLADRGDELLEKTLGRRRRAQDPAPGPRRPLRDAGADGVDRRGTARAAASVDVAARVLEAFRNDPVLLDRPIDIGAIGSGIVELTGWVDSPEEIRHATTLARGTIGVATVVNRLAVRGVPADA